MVKPDHVIERAYRAVVIAVREAAIVALQVLETRDALEHVLAAKAEAGQGFHGASPVMLFIGLIEHLVNTIDHMLNMSSAGCPAVRKLVKDASSGRHSGTGLPCTRCLDNETIIRTCALKAQRKD